MLEALMTRTVFHVFLVLAVILLAEAPAEAYLDPGAGSMLVQLVLGGVAGLAVVGKLLWHRLTVPFRKRDPDAGRP
jgi:hypothetical protein